MKIIQGLLILAFFSLTLGIADLQRVDPLNEASQTQLFPQSKTLTFSGYDWVVRTSNEELQGPGPNYFDDSNENVWIDGNGHLHLRITHKSGKWECAEIYSQKSFGHGTYVFKLAPGFEALDVNVVVGLFTYLDDTQEIDIEFTRWGDPNAQNGQFVVQPWAHWGNVERFDITETGMDTYHGFEWCEDYIYFWSIKGTELNYDRDNLIHEWMYKGLDNPKPSMERVHLNLWLMDGEAPTDGEETEIVIKEFQFISSDCQRYSHNFVILCRILISLALIGLISLSIILIKRLKNK